MKYRYGRLRYNKYDNKWMFYSWDGTKIFEAYTQWEIYKCLSDLGEESWKLVSTLSDIDFIMEQPI